MNFKPIDQISENYFDDSKDLKEVIEKYLIYWKWYLLSVVIFVGLALVKIRYEVPKYKVSAAILIKDKDEESSFSDLSSIEDLGLLGTGNNSLINEIQILNSRNLMTKVVKELKLNIRYFIDDTPNAREIFPNSPIIFNIKTDSLNVDRINTTFEVLIKSKENFEIIEFDDVSRGNKSFGKDFSINLGNKYKNDKREINITLNDFYNENLIGEKIIVSINALNIDVNRYMKRMIIEPIDDRLSDVVTLSIESTIRAKGKAVINNLIEQYNAVGINDKSNIADATIQFLDDRITLISAELSAIELSAAQFKTSRGMIDPNAEANYFLQSSSVSERDLVNANVQMELVSYMMKELDNSNFGDLLPSNIGLSDVSIVELVSEFNQLVLQRNRILKSSTNLNPQVVNFDSQLTVLKNNLGRSLNNLMSSLQIQIDAIKNNSGRINSRIASVPKHEKEFNDIIRSVETKNTLYLFLLQKREEAILSNVVKVNKAKEIDSAYSDEKPVSPKKMLILFAALIIGMIIPIIIIYSKDLLDTKIHDERDLSKLNLPYLGDIPLSTLKKNEFISDIDNSETAEAFRFLRTNINFMLDKKDIGKTIFLTSTLSQEGKTYTAINLALSLAFSGKKTILLAMDLRLPKISKYLALENNLGVSNFIKDKTLNMNQIINAHPHFDNLDMINSGDVPPNPVELLMSKRVSEIFNYLKENYEYIIVDTAPVGLVTDTMQISNFSDLTIYLFKANSSDKRLLQIPEKLFRENKLKNMAVLINGSDHSKGKYSYGFSYGYGNKKKKSWFQN